MMSLNKVLVSLRYINFRYYATIYEKSLIDYRQMPDVFYNRKKKSLPQKIFTAVVKAKDDVDDKAANLLMNLHYRYEFTLPALMNKAMINRVRLMRQRQMIPSDVIDELGVELSVAHMVVFLGGAVKLNGSSQWIGRMKGAQKLLPQTRAKNFRIDAIDLTGTTIMYEGLEFLPSLSRLKELQLGTTAFTDDHCLRRISRMRRHLEYLDLSNCPQISSKGLATLWSARNLKELNISNNPLLEDKELVCLLLTDKMPQLVIKGVDYFAALDNEQRSRLLQLLEKEHKTEQLSEDVDEDGASKDGGDNSERRMLSKS